MAVRADLAVMYIDLHDFDALRATQLFLVGAFEATSTDIIAFLIIGFSLQIVVIHLADITQDVSRYGAFIDAERTLLDIKTPKTIKLILPASILLLRNLLHKNRRRIRRVGASLVHFFDKIVVGDSQHLAHGSGIDIFGDTRNHHQIVDSLVIDEQFAVAVVDKPTSGILGAIAKCLLVGQLAVRRVENLEKEQSDDKNGAYDDDSQLYDRTSISINISHIEKGYPKGIQKEIKSQKYK